jgi:hypothetical protein
MGIVFILTMLEDYFGRRLVLGLAWVVISTAGVRAAPITVTDVKGRAIEVELVSLAGTSVTFRRAGSPKEFTLPLSNFADASQQLIRKEASQIPAAAPKIRADIIIGNRRYNGDSYYMKRQEISCTVKLTNTSLNTPIPTVSGKILFIGENRRTPELLQVLSAQDVEAAIEPGKTFVKEMDGFSTTYDSDNKGVDNIGGSQYIGYILVMTDAAKNVVVDQTLTGSFRQAITARPAILKELLTYSKGKVLTNKLGPAPIAGN